MKRISLTLLLLSALFLSANAQKTYALLSGVSNYGDEESNLFNTTKDVKQLKKVLDYQHVVSAIVTSQYANHDNIVKKLDVIVRLAKPEDNIIFFFSGHGNTSGFYTSDHTTFQYKELVNILKKSKAKNIVCFIDACMSGSVKGLSANNYGIGSGYPKITFVTASDESEVSMENNWVGNGFFTKAILKGLRGKADRNSDRQVTLIELFRYIYNDVTARTKTSKQIQHPQLIGAGSMYDMVLATW